MRELDRIALVGAGRLGTALAAALRASGRTVDGPLRRAEVPAADATLVVLCVPDAAIAAAAHAVPAGPLVAHVSGATKLAPLADAGHEALSVHPLMTVPAGSGADALRGAPAAVAGSTPRALAVARALAGACAMAPFEVADADRAAYHAASCMASNFLVTLEAAAEELGVTAGIDRAALLPIVRATAENWGATGGTALTGPIARGDEATVQAHRDAIEARTPHLVELFDALADATRALARGSVTVARGSVTDLKSRGGRHSDTNATLGASRNSTASTATAAAAPAPVVRSVSAVRALVAGWRAAGERVALVPTMGALHAGHAALIERAAAIADRVVVWIFVNPTQFTEQSDLAAYPRDEAGDVRTASAAGADVVFAPDVTEVYPDGFATTVSVAGPAEGLEGALRPGHFDGVATVVLKMLLMVGPDDVVFGAKDAQQVAVVRRLIRDLDVPVTLDVVPTVREPDGLARSSRNVHLSPAERASAAALSAGLHAAQAAAAAGERDAAALIAIAEGALRAAGIEPDYVAVVDPDSFRPIATVGRRALLALAARVGATRLIDNAELTPTQEA